MDQNAPPELTDTPESAYQDSKALIENGTTKTDFFTQLHRFAPTSSPQQLKMAGKLLKEFQTFICIRTCLKTLKRLIGSRFPRTRWLSDVYDHYGLLHQRSVFAHGFTYRIMNASA